MTRHSGWRIDLGSGIDVAYTVCPNGEFKRGNFMEKMVHYICPESDPRENSAEKMGMLYVP